MEKIEKTDNKLCSAWTSYNFSDLEGQKKCIIIFSIFPVSNLPRQFLCFLMQNLKKQLKEK